MTFSMRTRINLGRALNWSCIPGVMSTTALGESYLVMTSLSTTFYGVFSAPAVRRGWVRRLPPGAAALADREAPGGLAAQSIKVWRLAGR